MNLDKKKFVRWLKNQPKRVFLCQHGGNWSTTCPLATYLAEITGKLYSVGIETYCELTFLSKNDRYLTTKNTRVLPEWAKDFTAKVDNNMYKKERKIMGEQLLVFLKGKNHVNQKKEQGPMEGNP